LPTVMTAMGRRGVSTRINDEKGMKVQSAFSRREPIGSHAYPSPAKGARRLFVWLAAGISPLLMGAESSSQAPQRISKTPADIVKMWTGGAWEIKEVGRGENLTVQYGGWTEDEYDNPKLKSSQMPNPPPYNAQYQKKYDEVRAEAFKGKNVLDYGSQCYPYGMPDVMNGGVFEFMFAPDRIYIVIEEQGGVRRIWLDNRPLPPDFGREFNGWSLGHWEGRTLVVETTHIRPETTLMVGAPHSDALSVIERMTPDGPDKIQYQWTFIDPKALTRPWKGTLVFYHHKDWRIAERVCENNKTNYFNQGESGTLKDLDKSK
jgi:hypothetical protein